MTSARLAVVIAVLTLLAGLAFWQYHRMALVWACTDAGNIWDGARCLKAPGAPILQRELQRS